MFNIIHVQYNIMYIYICSLPTQDKTWRYTGFPSPIFLQPILGPDKRYLSTFFPRHMPRLESMHCPSKQLSSNRVSPEPSDDLFSTMIELRPGTWLVEPPAGVIDATTIWCDSMVAVITFILQDVTPIILWAEIQHSLQKTCSSRLKSFYQSHQPQSCSSLLTPTWISMEDSLPPSHSNSAS